MNLGMGAMIHHLGGGSKESAEKYYGRTITNVKFENDTFTLTFDDGVSIDITDQGQSCCESRYMTCDDNINALIGQSLRGITVKDTEDSSGEYGDCHEICFLEVQGDKGSVTFATHNEHNGYYGGFGLNIEEHGATK